MKCNLSRDVEVRAKVTQTVILADPTLSRESQLVAELNNRGYDVKIAQTHVGALALLSCEPQFVLLELRFESVDSLDLIATIRQGNPDCRIVVHTWFADVNAAVAVIKAGADDLLPKPLDARFVADVLTGKSAAKVGFHGLAPDVERIARTHIEAVFKASNGNMSLASKRLRLDRRSLQRIMKRYGVAGETSLITAPSYKSLQPSAE